MKNEEIISSIKEDIISSHKMTNVAYDLADILAGEKKSFLDVDDAQELVQINSWLIKAARVLVNLQEEITECLNKINEAQRK